MDFYLHDSTHNIDKHSKRLSLTTFETRIQLNYRGKFSLHHHKNCFLYLITDGQAQVRHGWQGPQGMGLA